MCSFLFAFFVVVQHVSKIHPCRLVKWSFYFHFHLHFGVLVKRPSRKVLAIYSSKNYPMNVFSYIFTNTGQLSVF